MDALNEFSSSFFYQIISSQSQLPFLQPHWIQVSFSLVEYGCFTKLCQLLLYSKGNQPYAHTQPLCFGFPSHSGRHRALSGVPCAAQSWARVSFKCDTEGLGEVYWLSVQCREKYVNIIYSRFDFVVIADIFYYNSSVFQRASICFTIWPQKYNLFYDLFNK